jgi:hypothetical protein
MKKPLLFLFLFSCALTVVAQTPIYLRQEIRKEKLENSAAFINANIIYPIRGACKISDGGMNYKTLELWVYDANEKEIYHTFQSVPTTDLYKDLVVVKMFDLEYKNFMLKHGYVLINRRHKEPALEHQYEISIK